MVDKPTEAPSKKAPSSILIFPQGCSTYALTLQHVNRVFLYGGFNPANSIEVPYWASEKFHGTSFEAIQETWKQLINPIFTSLKLQRTKKILVLRFSYEDFVRCGYDPIIPTLDQGHLLPQALEFGPDARHVVIVENVPMGKLHEANSFPTSSANLFILLGMTDETPSVPEALTAARLRAHIDRQPLPTLENLPPIPVPPRSRSEEATNVRTADTVPTPIVKRSTAPVADTKALETPALALAPRTAPVIPPSTKVPRPDTGYRLLRKPGYPVLAEHLTPLGGDGWPQPTAGSSHPPPGVSQEIPSAGAHPVPDEPVQKASGDDEPLSPDEKET